MAAEAEAEGRAKRQDEIMDLQQDLRTLDGKVRQVQFSGGHGPIADVDVLYRDSPQIVSSRTWGPNAHDKSYGNAREIDAPAVLVQDD